MTPRPNHPMDRMRGHALKRDDLLIARPPGVRRVYVGLRGGGYVRLSLADARALGEQLLRLAGDDETPSCTP